MGASGAGSQLMLVSYMPLARINFPEQIESTGAHQYESVVVTRPLTHTSARGERYLRQDER